MVNAYGSQNIEFGSATYGDIRLKIAKSHMKALDQPSQPCKKDAEILDTSQCIAQFIEDKIGCRIKLQGNDQVDAVLGKMFLFNYSVSLQLMV